MIFTIKSLQCKCIKVQEKNLPLLISVCSEVKKTLLIVSATKREKNTLDK